MSITVDLANKIYERSKSRNDGIYSYQGAVYRVRKNKPTHVAYGGKILSWHGNFFVKVGEYKNGQHEAKKLLLTVNG